MKAAAIDMIVIGGSAGSLDVIIQILQSLPEDFQEPVLLVIHRLKNTSSKLDKMLAKKTGIINISEPEDKEPIQQGMVYLAPQNYHVMVEKDHSFSLDYSQPVNYSRPSIDVSFDSFANVYSNRLMAILLSGANKDGAAGLKTVIAHGGTALIQNPATAAYPAMPKAALDFNVGAANYDPVQIVNCILETTAKKPKL